MINCFYTKQKNKILLIIILLIFPVFAFAQTEKMGLEQARTLALQNSRSLAQHNLNLRGRVLDEKAQNYRYYPSLSLGAQAGTTLFDWKEGTSADILKDNFYLTARAGISQTLFDWDGGRNSILKAITSLATESARQDALAEYYNVLNSVDSAYYAVLQAQAGLESAERSLEIANLSLSIDEIRRQSRMLNEPDYLSTLANKESREISRNQSRRELSMARLRLNNILGIKEQIELEPVDFDSYQPLISALALIDDAGFEKLRSRFWSSIVQRNPTLVKAGINRNVAEKNLSSANREYIPVFGASVSTGVNYNRQDGLKPAPLGLSLSASIPLDFWVISSNVERRKMALETSSMNYLGASESVDIELQMCLLNLVSGAGQIQLSSRALEYAGMSLEHVLELYRMGQRTQKDLYEAESSSSSSRNQYNANRFSFLSALSTLRSLGAFETGGEIEILEAELGLK